MKQGLIVSLLAGSMFLIVGCDDKKADAPAPAAVAVAAPAAAAPAAAAPAAAAGGDSVGVPECDDYLTKMTACLGKMPAASKAAMEPGLKASRDAWKTAAATPAGKDSLKASCKAAADAMAANPMCK